MKPVLRLFVLSILACGLLTLSDISNPSYSQNAPVDAEFNLEASKSLLEQAQDWADKGNYSQAIPLLEKASINIESIKFSHPDHYDTVLNLLMYSYWDVGRQDDADKIVERLRSNDGEGLETAFINQNGGLFHPLSQLNCPKISNGFVRDKAVIYRADGSDVSCNYKKLIPEYNLISLYATYAPQTDNLLNHQGVAEMLERNAPSLVWIEEQQEASFKAAEKYSVIGSIYILNQNTEDAYFSGVWTSNVEGWQVKARISWDFALGRDFGHNAARWAFNDSIVGMGAHQKNCATYETSSKSADVSDGPSRLASVLIYSALEPSSPVFELSSKACMGLTANEGAVIQRYHYDGPRLYSFTGTVFNNDYFVSRNEFLAPGEIKTPYSLLKVERSSEDQAIKVSVITSYSSAPEMEQAFQDMANFYNGNSSADGIIKYNKDGGSQITLNSDILEESEK